MDRPFRSVGVIGTGRYGGAVVRGWKCVGAPGAPVMLYDLNSDLLAALASELGMVAAQSVEHIAAQCDVVVVAVVDDAAPEVVQQVLAVRPDAWIVCISSGLTGAQVASIMPDTRKYVRVLPNILVRYGVGQVAVALRPEGDREAWRVIEALFAPVGRIYPVSAQEMALFRSTAGIVPAIMGEIVEGLFRDSPERAVLWWQEAIAAAAKVVLDGHASFDDLRTMGVNPGGASEAALRTMREHEVVETLAEAAGAARRAAASRERCME